ncbi:hypothetical protein D3C80_1579980 [compost metagenome]
MRLNPYHTRHTYACRMLTAGAKPPFIIGQREHERDPTGMLNKKLAWQVSLLRHQTN